MKVFEFWKKYLMSFYILISSHHFILDILFKKFAKNEFLYSIKNNSPYGIKKQKNTSTWDTEVTPKNQCLMFFQNKNQKERCSKQKTQFVQDFWICSSWRWQEKWCTSMQTFLSISSSAHLCMWDWRSINNKRFWFMSC